MRCKEKDIKCLFLIVKKPISYCGTNKREVKIKDLENVIAPNFCPLKRGNK